MAARLLAVRLTYSNQSPSNQAALCGFFYVYIKRK